MEPTTCRISGKIPYATKAKAVMVCASLRKRNKYRGVKIAPARPYKCQFCHHYHAGHDDFSKAGK